MLPHTTQARTILCTAMLSFPNGVCRAMPQIEQMDCQDGFVTVDEDSSNPNG